MEEEGVHEEKLISGLVIVLSMLLQQFFYLLPVVITFSAHFLGKTVELFNGTVIITDMPESMKHYWTKMNLCEILKKASSKHTRPPIDVLVEIPVMFDSDLFQPDITIVDGAKYVNRCRCNPTKEMVLTVIEVSLSSLMDDVNNKVFKYAAANTKEVWVVDLLHEVVHVYKEPENGMYHSVTVLTVDKNIEFCGKKIPVREIFREN